MGSPRRGRREQEKRVDIKDRLQALAKSSANDIKKSAGASKSGSKSGGSANKDRGRNNSRGNRKGIEQMMEKARSEGGSRWTKKLLDEEAKDPDRWGHSGFKELYKSELGIKSRRSRSCERLKNRRSRSRDRREPRKTSRGRDTRSSPNVRRKRSPSSSDRSMSDGRKRTDSGKRNGNSNDRQAGKSSKAANTRNDRKRDLSAKRDRLKKHSISRSKSRSRTPVRLSSKKSETTKRNSKRGPVSPPLNRYSRSSSRSSESPVRRRASISESSQSSSSSRSQSSMSRSSSSSSSSARSSSSDSSPGRRRVKKRRPSINSQRTKAKQAEQHKSKPNHTKASKKSDKVKESLARKSRDKSASRSSSNASSDSESDVEEGEDDDRDEDVLKETKLNPPQRISLSERFGKLAQLSSQRRSLELVQLRIVAPVGGTEKNVSVDETSAAPVISKPPRERSAEPPTNNHNHHAEHHHFKQTHHHEEHTLPEERARDDRWRDWHERYDHYRHVQPPRQLPRDWDDIRVRHKYYTDRGYFGHDMTLEELSRWEAWWHRYQQWRRGYEHAWIKTHGPHVPVEYPDWSHYRSSSVRGEAAPVNSSGSSVRSRLGWRR